MDWRQADYSLTDDLARLDLDAVCNLLHSTYWAANRSREVIEKSLRHSVNFSLLWGEAQVGMARLITDYSTHGYLCDVVIASQHRGQGRGRWMIEQIMHHPSLAGCRLDLVTRDAQEFYRSLGFGSHPYHFLVRYGEDYAGGNSVDQASAPVSSV
jgi:ribosomal protein S18 acetylase RimI-like enzyme